jgi:hypothetical protein
MPMISLNKPPHNGSDSAIRTPLKTFHFNIKRGCADNSPPPGGEGSGEGGINNESDQWQRHPPPTPPIKGGEFSFRHGISDGEFEEGLPLLPSNLWRHSINAAQLQHF